MSNPIYQQVTDTIIKQLEQGAAAWQKCWTLSAGGGAPKNLVTGKHYRGMNTLILAMAQSAGGYQSNIWASYQQLKAAGHQVQKGQRGTSIVFYKPVASQIDDETGEVSAGYAVLKTYTVFNLAQTDAEIIPPAEVPAFEIDALCEATIKNTGADIQHGFDSACYIPSLDVIHMPEKAAFDSPAHYYATAFHELCHWTGAKSRLNRDLTGRFGNPEYAFEELIAELGAAYLCASHNIQGDLRHAGYIQSWLKCLRDDNRAIFKAAAYAQKAADEVLGTVYEVQGADSEQQAA